MAEMLDTLRWIIDKDGAIPAKGSDREQRFIDLWTKRLRLPAEAHRDSAGLQAVIDKLIWDAIGENEGCSHHYGNLTYSCNCTVRVEDLRRALSGSEGDGE